MRIKMNVVTNKVNLLGYVSTNIYLANFYYFTVKSQLLDEPIIFF